MKSQLEEKWIENLTLTHCQMVRLEMNDRKPLSAITVKAVAVYYRQDPIEISTRIACGLISAGELKLSGSGNDKT